MGFIHDIRKILALLPKQRQNLLFSATFSNEVKQLAKGFIHNPIEIAINPTETTVSTVEQWIVPVDKKQKIELLIHLIEEQQWAQVLVFSRTKHGANKLARLLEKANIKTAAIHGNKSQSARTKALNNFKQNTIQVLVATDIAARGLDIDQLPHVINFDLPNVPEDYVHRIGRTGRANSTGEAISLVSADESKQLRDIERLIKTLLTRKIIEGFEPMNDVPPSTLDTRPKKPKKPKAAHRDGQRRSGARKNTNPVKINGSKNRSRSH
jgi:ATP-dependent RNA helicase RhlE